MHESRKKMNKKKKKKKIKRRNNNKKNEKKWLNTHVLTMRMICQFQLLQVQNEMERVSVDVGTE